VRGTADESKQVSPHQHIRCLSIIMCEWLGRRLVNKNEGKHAGCAQMRDRGTISSLSLLHSSVKSTLLAPRRRRNQNGGQEIGCEASHAQLWKIRPCTGVGGGGECQTHRSRVETTRMEEACCWLGDSEGHDMDGKFPMVGKKGERKGGNRLLAS
jgi:hypothetical protein